MSKGILVYCEVTRENYLHTAAFELAAKAFELSAKLSDTPVMALVISKPDLINNFEEAFKNNGFSQVFYVADEKLETYRSDIYSKAAIEAVRQIDPEIMLIAATNQGRDIAPRISTALHTGLTADCTAIDINETGKMAATRPTFGGQLMATILSKSCPQMATISPGVLKPLKETVYKDTVFTKIDTDLNNYESKIEILDFSKRISTELNNIDSADIIIAGGRGMQSKEGFELLQKLADKLGGAVGASRVAVEMGLAPQNCQIGQTGKTVTPKLYIACGISGALQHTVGMENSSKIIAINNDKDAPIFKIADYGYIGDAFEVIPNLLNSEELFKKDF